LVLFSSGFDLAVMQIIEYYGVRWKIESGFKELKQDIGRRTRQCRNAQAALNHLHLFAMAAMIAWIYVDRLKADPERRHKVKGRTGFAFSDVRCIIAEATLTEDFHRVCPKPGNPLSISLIRMLLLMLA
jgi:hypothetical protein